MYVPGLSLSPGVRRRDLLSRRRSVSGREECRAAPRGFARIFAHAQSSPPQAVPRVSRTARRNRPARASHGTQVPSSAPAPARRLSFALDGGAPAAWPALNWVALALVAAYAATLLWLTFGPHRVGDVFTETDFYGSYGPGARLIQQGHLIPSRYGVVGPMFEVLLAGLGFVVHDLFLAAGLIAALAMTAALLLWWSLIARRTGSAVALLAVAFMATNAQCFRYGWSVTTDAPAFAFQAAALWALLGAAEGTAVSPRRMFAAGALAACAFLTRYNSIALLPAGLLAIGLGWNGVAKGGRARASLVFAAGFLAPVLPWVVFSASHGGAMRFQLHHNIAYEVFARPHGIVWDVYERDMEGQFPTPWSVLARDPVAVISRMGFNLFDHLRLDALKLAGIPLALAAAFGAWCAWKDGLLEAPAAARGDGALLLDARARVPFRALLARGAAAVVRARGLGVRLAEVRALDRRRVVEAPAPAAGVGPRDRCHPGVRPARALPAPGGGAHGGRSDPTVRASRGQGAGEEAALRLVRRHDAAHAAPDRHALGLGRRRTAHGSTLALLLLARGGDAAQVRVAARLHEPRTGAHAGRRHRALARARLPDRPRFRARAGLDRARHAGGAPPRAGAGAGGREGRPRARVPRHARVLPPEPRAGAGVHRPVAGARATGPGCAHARRREPTAVERP